MRKVEINISGEKVGLSVEGDVAFGDDKVLLLQDDDLTKTTTWHADGYTVVPFLKMVFFQQIYNGITDLIRSFIEKETNVSIPGFTLEKYHEFCSDNVLHLAVISHIKQCLSVEQFPIDYRLVEKRVSEICGIDVTSQHPDNELFEKVFCIRIVRPQRNTDNNPPHRDVWLDKLRNAINIYMPLVGSNAQSSLPLMPGSHYWNESEIMRSTTGSKVNGVAFVVPCVVGSKNGLNMIRPLPKNNEMIVFSPYLIHGGGCNLNKDETRVSIEMRFWRNTGQNDNKLNMLEQRDIKSNLC